jgi:hypothetical protein
VAEPRDTRDPDGEWKPKQRRLLARWFLDESFWRDVVTRTVSGLIILTVGAIGASFAGLVQIEIDWLAVGRFTATIALFGVGLGGSRLVWRLWRSFSPPPAPAKKALNRGIDRILAVSGRALLLILWLLGMTLLLDTMALVLGSELRVLEAP